MSTPAERMAWRTGTCRGCGDSFRYPLTGPARLYCPGAECRQRAQNRRAWAYRARMAALGVAEPDFLQQLPGLEELQIRESPRRHSDNFSARFRDHDEVAWKYETILMLDPCSYCGATPADLAGGPVVRGQTGHRMQVDHIDAFHAGGPGAWDNLTAACRSCNSSKGAHALLYWLLTSPRLAGRQQLTLDLGAAA